jgi:hypothetical protein
MARSGYSGTNAITMKNDEMVTVGVIISGGDYEYKEPSELMYLGKKYSTKRIVGTTFASVNHPDVKEFLSKVLPQELIQSDFQD